MALGHHRDERRIRVAIGISRAGVAAQWMTRTAGCMSQPASAADLT